jgi:hypothetical protein
MFFPNVAFGHSFVLPVVYSILSRGAYYEMHTRFQETLIKREERLYVG